LKTVTEITEGTKSEAEGIGNPEAEGGTPEGESKVSSGDKIYTQAQVDLFIQSAKSEAGRKVKELEDENTTLKSQLTDKDSQLSIVQTDIEEIQKELNEMAKDDPDKKAYTEKLRALKDTERQLRAERATLDAEKKTIAEQKKNAQEGNRKLTIWEVANEYQDGDMAKLQTLCDNLGIDSREQIKIVADTLGWTPNPTETKDGKQTMKVLSGGGGGGQKEKTEQEKLKERYPSMFSK